MSTIFLEIVLKSMVFLVPPPNPDLSPSRLIRYFFFRIALTPMLFGYFLVHVRGSCTILDVRMCTPYGIFRSRGILTAVNIQKNFLFFRRWRTNLPVATGILNS